MNDWGLDTHGWLREACSHDYRVVDVNIVHDRIVEACELCGARRVRLVDEERDVEPDAR